MPVTPFHMGPGVAIKAVAGRYFGLMVFGFSQLAMDIEPLVRIIRGDGMLHTFTHTYLGATLIGLVSAVVGRPICQSLLNYWTPDPYSPFMNWLRGPKAYLLARSHRRRLRGHMQSRLSGQHHALRHAPLCTSIGGQRLAACHLGRRSTSPVRALRCPWCSSDVRHVFHSWGNSC